MKINKVYVIGTGALAVSCAEHAMQEGARVFLYDMGKKASVMMERQAGQKRIPYVHQKPAEVFSRLCECEEEILLVSAINEWIVPGKVLDKQNITAVNLHQALLPEHPGRNAEAWAIFDQDEKAGITWHYMESKVDKGDILVQKEIRLLEDTTAITLFRQQIACAIEGFREICRPLLKGQCAGIPQPGKLKGEFHFNKDVPNGGWLDPGWEGKKMSAFLRAVDYGVLKIWDPPKIRLARSVFEWQKYGLQRRPGRRGERVELVKAEEHEKMVFHIRIVKDDIEILLKNCRKTEEIEWKN